MNITLIGMPGSGKSTYGKKLAEALEMNFIDVDDLIVEATKMSLPEIISQKGDEEFLRIEDEIVLNIEVENCVIATGGSVPLANKGMSHLAEISTVFYIDVPLSVLEQRRPPEKRKNVFGITKFKSFEELFEYRTEYYKKFADFTYVSKGSDTYPLFEEFVKSNLK